MSEPRSHAFSRRAFVQTTAALTAGLVLPHRLHAAGRERAVLAVGWSRRGGRGRGAARECLRGNEDVVLVALGDALPDRLKSCRENLTKVASEDPAFAAKYKVVDEHCYTGFDAFEKVLATDIDL